MGKEHYVEQLQKLLKTCDTVINSSSNLCTVSCQLQFISYHSCYAECTPTRGSFLRLENTTCISMLQKELPNVYCGPLEAWIGMMVVGVVVFILLVLLICRYWSKRGRTVIVELPKSQQSFAKASDVPLALA